MNGINTKEAPQLSNLSKEEEFNEKSKLFRYVLTKTCFMGDNVPFTCPEVDQTMTFELKN